MADERYITQAQADAAKAKPIVTRGQPNQPPGIAPFFVEEIRKHLEQQYGAKALYENGLSVTTTLDVKLQEAANRGDRARAAAARQAPRLPASRARNVVAEGHTIDTFKDDRWNRPMAAGDVVPGRRRHRAEDRRRARDPGRPAITPTWRAKASPGRGARPRPTCSSRAISIDVGVTKIDEAAGDRVGDARADAARRSARSWPSTTAPARFARWSADGASAAASSTARCRRTGSSDRPSSRSSTRRPSIAASRRRRSSSTRRSAIPAGNGDDLQPAELRSQVRGPGHAAPRARGLAQHSGDQDDGRRSSRRTCSTTRSGSASTQNFPPYLPIALGAGDATLLEVTSAYTVFPNQGVRMKPFEVLKVHGSRGQPARREPRRSRSTSSAPTRRS